MNKRMIYLISLIAEMGQKLTIPQIYSKKFESSGNEYLSPTEKIRIEDMTDFFVTAGIVGRTEVLPIIGKDGGRAIELEPDVIGGQYPYSASDLIEVKAGVPTFTQTGSEIPSIEQLEAKGARIIAAALRNKFEKQCVDVFFKGTYKDKDGKVLEVGTKSDKTLNWNGKTKIADEIFALALEYQTKHQEFPKIEVGSTIFNALKNEALVVNQNLNGVRFIYGENPYIELNGGLRIDLLVGAKGTDDKLVDPKDLMVFYSLKTLAVGYGCLMYGDVKSNTSHLVKAKTISGDLRVEEMTGSAGLWGKSAPMPLILSVDKFRRYKVTISE